MATLYSRNLQAQVVRRIVKDYKTWIEEYNDARKSKQERVIVDSATKEDFKIQKAVLKAGSILKASQTLEISKAKIYTALARTSVSLQEKE